MGLVGEGPQRRPSPLPRLVSLLLLLSVVCLFQINSMRVGDVVDIGIHRNHRDQRVRVVIEGTDKAQGPKKIIPSSNAVHTDN